MGGILGNTHTQFFFSFSFFYFEGWGETNSHLSSSAYCYYVVSVGAFSGSCGCESLVWPNTGLFLSCAKDVLLLERVGDRSTQWDISKP